MKQVKLKSFRDLSEIKNLVISSSQNNVTENVSVESKTVAQRKDYKQLTESDRGKWVSFARSGQRYA